MIGTVQGLAEYERMGLPSPEKSVSTGTLTKTVTNTMEQNKASQNFFSELFLILSVFISIAFFSSYTYTVTFLVWVLGSNIKVISRNVLGICVKLSLVMLTICKSHFQAFY